MYRCLHELAEEIAQRFDFIDAVMATDDSVNLTGKNKAGLAVSRFGEKGFDYLGNEQLDLEVWRHARRALVVGDQSLADSAAGVSEVVRHFDDTKPGLRTRLRAIRIHQWAKNFLVFVPLLTAHKMFDPGAVSSAIIAFICLGLVASATYLFNDLMDIHDDRQHPVKKGRPIAAGSLSISAAVTMGMVLFVSGFALAASLSSLFVLTLLFYAITTVAYSFKLKRLQTVDVITLAGLFTIRVIAGAAAIEVRLSFWLLCFSMFTFLSLAMVKRVVELIRIEKLKGGTDEKVGGRGYFTNDLVILQNLGGTSGFISVLVIALYLNSPEIVSLYRQPEILWLILPVYGYWIMRIWMLVVRDEMDDDPIKFAITDKNSIIAAVLMMLILGVATYY